MYIYLCRGVTDNQIRSAIYEGCCSYREAREATSVGTRYGKCACLAKQMIRETLNDLQSTRPVPAFGITAFVAA